MPGRPSRLHIQDLRRFHGLHPDFETLGTPSTHTKQGKTSNDAAGFASRYGPAQSLPPKWLSTLGLDVGRSLPSRQPATGPPDSYPNLTHTDRRRRVDNYNIYT